MPVQGLGWRSVFIIKVPIVLIVAAAVSTAALIPARERHLAQ
ncbi:MAG TPA: hypothetical protein VI074_11170 [Propionibacteriaceae bacterium]